jgi:hypothetical protein
MVAKEVIGMGGKKKDKKGDKKKDKKGDKK